MKVLETQSAVLSNYEVLVHLRDVEKCYATHPDYNDTNVKNWKGEKVRVDARLKGLRMVVTDLLRYLQHDDSPLITPNATYRPEAFRLLLEKLAKFHFTKSELLMILNIRPKDATALDVIVEELDTRLSAEEQEEVVNIVGEVLGKEPEKGVEEEEGAEDGDEANAMDVDGTDG